jgi:hypothetical protein
MLFKARSAAVYGIDAHLIDVEVDFSQIKLDKEQFSTVGLPDAAVRESRDRVKSAIKNSGFEIPPTKITINLAPADLKKEGSGFDLPIAVGILGAYGALSIKDLSDFLLVGELGLDGSLRAVPGTLPIAAASMNRAGKLKLIAAREIVTVPSSSGCRRTSSTLRGNSGSSSRNSSPLCASETSPGRGTIPPPIKPASEIVWCGERKGR